MTLSFPWSYSSWVNFFTGTFLLIFLPSNIITTDAGINPRLMGAINPRNKDIFVSGKETFFEICNRNSFFEGITLFFYYEAITQDLTLDLLLLLLLLLCESCLL
jgi:hypothetical protein